MSVPDAGPRSIVVTAARAAGRDQGRRVRQRLGDGLAARPARRPRAARSCGSRRSATRGELLGLIVVERPARGDSFTDEDDRVLTELARQVGLALPQRPARLGAADHARRAARAGRGAARVPRPHRGQRRRRAPPSRAQPARRRPADLVALAVNLRLARDMLDRRARRRPAEMLDQLAEDLQGHDPGAARAGPRHLSAAAGRQRPRRRR